MAPAIREAISIPFLDIFAVTAEAVVGAGCARPALMATAYTMEQDFCLGRLREAGLAPVVPAAAERAEIHRIIFEELCKGITTDESRRAYEKAQLVGTVGGALDGGAQR